MRYRGIVLAVGALGLLSPAMAHDSPGDAIHALTHRMETRGPTARLLAARGFEYEYLGQWDAAAADFETSLALQPTYGAAATGLAQVLLRQDHLEKAEAVAHQGLGLEDEPERRAPYWAVIAEARARQDRWEPALAAWRQALASPRADVDWFLGEAECLARLGRYEERAAALAAAIARNPSVVLHRTWVRALVDAGMLEEALREIDRGLERAHWKSTWLLLRARVHARRGERVEQEADAAAALEEIRTRWNREHADRDPYLDADAGLALALLGDVEEAGDYLDRARGAGVPEVYLLETRRLLSSAKSPGR